MTSSILFDFKNEGVSNIPVAAREDCCIKSFLFYWKHKFLCNQTFYYFTRNICQPVTAAKVLECKLFMIQSHQIQDRCMKIVNMYRVLCDVITKFISLTVNSRLYTTASHPYRKATGMMIPSVIIFF